MQAGEQFSQPRSWSFDALAYIKHMDAVGFTREQAVALAEEQNKLIDDRLATKTDIEQLRLAAKTDVAYLETKMAQINAETKADLIKWVVGIGFAQVAMIITFLKFHM